MLDLAPSSGEIADHPQALRGSEVAKGMDRF